VETDPNLKKKTNIKVFTQFWKST